MAARLRKTFHYPSDDNNNDDASSTPSVLDEQEQESLITTLTHLNTSRNASFHRLLYALPLLSTIPFLLRIFLPTAAQSQSQSPLLTILGLSSLAATGWLLHRQGVTETGFAALDGESGRGISQTATGGMGPGSGTRIDSGRGVTGIGRGLGRGHSGSRAGASGMPFSGMGEKSPLEQHLPLLNILLAVLALLTGFLEQARMVSGTGGGGGGGPSPVLLGALPGVVYAVVVGAKVVMAGVDPEQELGGLKYGYKGA